MNHSRPNRPGPPVILVVLDGWGLSESDHGNAVRLANTPVFNDLVAKYPQARLTTWGPAVGLPEGQMGNSEVGHLNLGAGFVVRQELLRIGETIDSGDFFSVEALRHAFAHAKARNSRVHLMGLIGEGGVHAHADHLLALLEMARREDVDQVALHAFTDGRDAPPRSGRSFMADIQTALDDVGIGSVATVSGRYYAMDRDQRWDRTQKAWDAMVNGTGPTAPSAERAIVDAYESDVTDEFIVPTVIVANGQPVATVKSGDAVIMFNFRADRMRPLLRAFTEPDFGGFPRELPDDLYVVTMTQYFPDGQRAPVAFEPSSVEWPLARVVSEAGLRQYHTAETEKYAHVTYFFNGGRETPFPGEDRFLEPSPLVPTYDQAPDMSAVPVTDALVERIGAGHDAFLIVNYANPDMVGHTGDLDAAIQAVETADRCLGRVVEAILAAGGYAVITADHGNCEMMIDPDTGGPHTAHTMNPTPFIVAGNGMERDAGGRVSDGALADVAPTCLHLMGLPTPKAMTGQILAHRRDDE